MNIMIMMINYHIVLFLECVVIVVEIDFTVFNTYILDNYY